jgi:hypothetical protein
MVDRDKLPLWVERVLLPTAWDVTIGEDQTISAHWAKHYYDHGHGETLQESMDLFHEDLMRSPGFETEYRSTIGPVALAAALPHPLSHDLIFPHLREAQRSQAMVTGQTSDLEFGYGLPQMATHLDVGELLEVSDLGFGYGGPGAIPGKGPGSLEGYTYDPSLIIGYGDSGYEIQRDPIGSDWRTDPKKKRPESITYTVKEDPVPTNGPLSVTSLDFGYGAAAHSIPSLAGANVLAAPRRTRRSPRVSVGKNIPRVKTMSKLNKFMHEWRKEIRQIEGRLGGFYGTSRPSRRRKALPRHRHRIKSFSYRRGGKPVHSHRVKSYRRRR